MQFWRDHGSIPSRHGSKKEFVCKKCPDAKNLETTEATGLGDFSGSSQLMSREERLKSTPEAGVQGPPFETRNFPPLTYLSLGWGALGFI